MRTLTRRVRLQGARIITTDTRDEQDRERMPVQGIEIQGKRVTAMGLGRFGGQIAAIRYLYHRGAEILVTDQAAPETLRESIAALRDAEGICFRFGPHQPEDFLNADLILASPAVKPGHACLRAAAERGIPIVTEMELFLQNCPARMIAVSGTVGKSTTATMLAHLLRAAGFSVQVGGNIGESLLPQIGQLTSEMLVVLELSSFQLHWLRRNSPRFEVALLTSFFPHHLEWHGTAEEYRQCKQALFAGQTAEDLAVLPAEGLDQSLWPTRGERRFFSREAVLHRAAFPSDWPPHFLTNAAAVLRVADWLGIDEANACQALSTYQPLPHRLERVDQLQQRIFVNDSKATSPWAVIAALRALPGPLWLILGGAISTDNPDTLLQELRMHAGLRGIAWMGPAGRVWQQHPALAARCALPAGLESTLVDSLAEAFRWSWEKSREGDTILLSPGAPSFNEFLHFEQRGELFRQLALASKTASG